MATEINSRKRIDCTVRGSRIILQDLTEVQVIDAATVSGLEIMGAPGGAKAIKVTRKFGLNICAFVTDDVENARDVMCQLATVLAAVTPEQEEEAAVNAAASAMARKKEREAMEASMKSMLGDLGGLEGVLGRAKREG